MTVGRPLTYDREAALDEAMALSCNTDMKRRRCMTWRRERNSPRAASIRELVTNTPDLLSWPVTEGLHLAVRFVLYEMCLPEGGSAVPEIIDFPVDDIVALIPKACEVDFQDGSFSGSFTLG